MRSSCRSRILLSALSCWRLAGTETTNRELAPTGMSDGRESHDALVSLFDEFVEWRDSDFTDDAATVADREKGVAKFQARVFKLVRTWIREGLVQRLVVE